MPAKATVSTPDTHTHTTVNPVRLLRSLLLPALLSSVTIPTLATQDPTAPVTYYHDVLPVILNACASCHRPGQPGPFSLLDPTTASEHREAIKRETTRRRMPPWQLDPVCGDFAGRRPLTDAEITLISRWVDLGAPAGEPKDAPPIPIWTDGWQGGKPDLIVRMPRPFPVPANTKDIYRNFTVPVPLDRPRYVRAVEFRPGNNRVVHHAFVYIDGSGQSRAFDGRDGTPGYRYNMQPIEVKMPQGQFLTWQPGKVTASGDSSLPWLLNTNTDLVLSLHLVGTTTTQPAQSEVGLYFTDTPPRLTAFKLGLMSLAMDIPPNATNYLAEDSFTLPADVEAWSVLPHAHRLATTLEGWANLPDGTQRWLVRIPHWDFNWQGDYKYAKPLFLPKGSVLHMRYRFDNPPITPPNGGTPTPPTRVRYGPQTSDEMAELWLQLVLRNPGDLPRLEAEQQRHAAHLIESGARARLASDPLDPLGNLDLGKLLLLRKGGLTQAEQRFRTVVHTRPDLDEGHYQLGLVLRMSNRPAEAQFEFEQALKLNPDDYKTHGNLGMIAADLGDRPKAIHHFQQALKLNPADSLSREALNELSPRTTTP